MRLLVLLAAALFLTAMHAQAQVYAPYDGYDEYDGYGYDDPYSPYPPPPY
ncbi:L,D-transpeptidase, partial [Rhizobium ruizarguesonis]